MRKNLLITVVIAVAAYVIGVQSAKSRGKNYEDLRHQLERLLTDPDAKKKRKRMAKKAKKSIEKAQKNFLGH